MTPNTEKLEYDRLMPGAVIHHPEVAFDMTATQPTEPENFWTRLKAETRWSGELADRLRAALSDSIDRDVFEVRFVQGRSPADAAKALGLSVDAIDQRLHRMRERFRDAGLAEDHPLS